MLRDLTPFAAPDPRLWHPWLRINRVLRVMLHTRWSASAWHVVRIEFRRALALRSEIWRAGWSTNSQELTSVLYIYIVYAGDGVTRAEAATCSGW